MLQSKPFVDTLMVSNFKTVESSTITCFYRQFEGKSENNSCSLAFRIAIITYRIFDCFDVTVFVSHL